MNMAGAPPLLELYYSYDQWTEERAVLQERHRELSQLLKWNPNNFDYPDWEGFHRQIQQQFVDFFRDWDRHQECEQRMIVPIAHSCAGGYWLPVQLLEKESLLARQFYQNYEENAGLAGSGPKQPAEQSLIMMLQVLMLLSEHFRTEEETVIPAIESLLEQVDYSAL